MTSSGMFKIEKKEDGTYAANWPALKTGGPLTAYAVGETGGYVVGALKDPKTWISRCHLLLLFNFGLF